MEKNNFSRYAISFIICVIALFIQLELKHVVDTIHFLLLYPAVFLIAWLFGLGPTIVFSFLTAIASNILFFEHPHTFNNPNTSVLIKLISYSFLSIAIGALISNGKEKLKKSLKNSADLKYALDKSSIVAITDAKGKITYVNEKFCEISKYSAEEILGNDHRLINSQYHDKDFFAHLWNTIKNGEVWAGEIQNRAKDGTLYWVSTTIVPFLDERNKPYQYIAIRHDITQRKKAEEQLKIAIKSRDEFLSIASHELKTPLTSLMLQTQLFKRGITAGDERFLEKERIKKLIEQVDRQSVRLTRLVDDMLDVGRINSGRLTIQKEVISLTDLFHDVVERLAPVMQETNTPVDYICHELIESNCDKYRIEQVLINLLTNTIKYGDKKPVLVTLEKVDDKAHLKVIDHGRGVPDEVKDKIFNRFERAVSFHEVTGMGLGLYITKEIVEAHGGNIWVESAGLKQGSIFHVELPLAH